MPPHLLSEVLSRDCPKTKKKKKKLSRSHLRSCHIIKTGIMTKVIRFFKRLKFLSSIMILDLKVKS